MESIGELLREWRIRRRMSQLELATDADISTKHLSFLETGRSRPSRQMLLRLTGCLDVPLRERNRMLKTAGFATAFEERAFFAPALTMVRRSVEDLLGAYDPVPALVTDRHWTILATNRAMEHLFTGTEWNGRPGSVNVLRLCLHPSGLAPRIVNFSQWRAHIIARLRRQIDLRGDPVLMSLLEEIRSYPCPRNAPEEETVQSDIAVPLRLRAASGVLSFFSTTTLFDTPVDITVSELAIEALMPADEETASIMQRVAGRTAWPHSDALAAD